MIAFLFPGQGSQKLGMGRDLFGRFREHVATADRVLGYSVEQLCTESDGARLNETEYTQPALYVVNALACMAKREEGVKPAIVAGHSLGEYNALWAAGVFDFETGLRLVQKRGEVMAKAKNGGMAAVVGMDGTAVRQVLADARIDVLDVANLNTPTQTVLSGPAQAIVDAQGIFEAAGARAYIKLPVSGAFHSRYMEPAQAEFEAFASSFAFAEPSIPVLANANARAYTSERTKRLLVSQIGQTVVWTAIIERMVELGVTEFMEVGHGSTLTKFVEQIRQRSSGANRHGDSRAESGQSVTRAVADGKAPAPGRREDNAGSMKTNGLAAATDDPVFGALREAILQVLPDLDASGIVREGRLRELGANSVDRAEILTLTMQKLRLRIPLVDLARAQNIGMLADIFRQRGQA